MVEFCRNRHGNPSQLKVEKYPRQLCLAQHLLSSRTHQVLVRLFYKTTRQIYDTYRIIFVPTASTSPLSQACCKSLVLQKQTGAHHRHTTQTSPTVRNVNQRQEPPGEIVMSCGGNGAIIPRRICPITAWRCDEMVGGETPRIRDSPSIL